MKNTIYAIIIAACILVAVLVFVKTRSGGSGGLDSISDAQMTWMKCRACNATYEMSYKQYLKDVSEKATASAATMGLTPPLTCEKCGKNMAFQAEKCPNCNEVFFPGSVVGDYPDRCPKCKHSKVEDSRKARQQGQQ